MIIEKPLGLVEEREPERVTVIRATAASSDLEHALAEAPEAPLPIALAPQLATLASAASPGVTTSVLPTRSMTSPGRTPLSSASLPGVTAPTTTPLEDEVRPS